jgi:molecular chaperone GrpE (heat shock protein)
MGLTVNFQRPNVRDITAPKAPISGDQIESLGKGIGSFYRWNERQKAAEMMEGKAKAQARIAEIDKEIAELEGQLKSIEDARAKEQAERDEANQQAMVEENRARQNAMAALDAQRKYRWR